METKTRRLLAAQLDQATRRLAAMETVGDANADSQRSRVEQLRVEIMFHDERNGPPAAGIGAGGGLWPQ